MSKIIKIQIIKDYVLVSLPYLCHFVKITILKKDTWTQSSILKDEDLRQKEGLGKIRWKSNKQQDNRNRTILTKLKKKDR